MKSYYRLIKVVFVSTVLLLVACTQPELSGLVKPTEEISKTIATATISNPSDDARPHNMQYFSFYDLGLAQHYDGQLSVHFEKEELQSEITDNDFDGKADGVLVHIPLQSAQTITIDFVESEATPSDKLTQAEISHKVNGEWVAHSKYPDTNKQEYVGGEFVNVESLIAPPQYTDHSNYIRYEGPGIESNLVGYRVYLDWRNGFDIFGKLTDQPALQQVGQDGYQSYHDMQDWGMDILKVGTSLGAGGFALWQDDSVKYINKVGQHKATINANGNLSSAFTISYDDWQSEQGTQSFTSTLSMQAFSPWVENYLRFEQNPQAIAVGVVKHPESELIQGDIDITGKAYTYIASWGPQALDGSQLGMAVMFRKEDLVKTTTDKSNYIAVLEPSGTNSPNENSPYELSYSFAAFWAPKSGINTKHDFEILLKKHAENQTIPPRVSIQNKLAINTKKQIESADDALFWGKKLADSELVRKGDTYAHDKWDVNRKRLPKFEYDIVGLYPYSLYELWLATGEADYGRAIFDITSTFITPEGGIERYTFDNFNIDSVAPGRAVLALYKETGEQKYKLAADLLRKQLAEQPTTSEGAFWHKRKYPHQLWLDGVYMGLPFLAEYAVLFNEPESLKTVVKEFELTEKYLKNKKTGLYYHGWDESRQQGWANQETGLSEEIWARGLGWFAMALVDVLDIIPEQEKELRAPLIHIANDLVKTLLSYQDQASGLWWQIMDKPNATGNYLESSSSSMFVYFMARAQSQGYLSEDISGQVVSAFENILNTFILPHADGLVSMTHQCYVAGLGFGRDGSYHYYMTEPVYRNDPKGNGPFILASIAVSNMMKGAK